MAKNSQTTRTTLWDDLDPVSTSAPVNSGARGAWRAPSAVLASNAANRRVVSAMPPVAFAGEDGDDRVPIPRRTKFPTPRGSHFAGAWWRPYSTFGRILFGTGLALALAALASGAWITRQFLIRDPRFRIEGATSIQSSGLSEVNRADVLPVFGSDIGRNIFFVPLAERRRELEAIPWVQQATVMRFLPDRLSVSIVERTPVALVSQGNKIELVDADGVILDMPPAMMAQHHYSFPVIHGIDGRSPLAARRARMAVYLRFVAELDRNNQHLTAQVSEIDLTDPEDLRATITEPGSDILAHFGEDQFLNRLQIYQSHIAEWRSRYPRLKGVDLRYNGEVPLEMDTSAPAVAATAPGTAGAAKALPAPTQPEPAKSAPQAVTAKPIAKAKPGKINLTVAQKQADAKRKAAKLKAEKAKAAKSKTAARKTPVAARQGQ